MPEWKKFEEQVRRVFDTLLNLKDEGIVVARNVRIKGRDGILHQFERAAAALSNTSRRVRRLVCARGWWGGRARNKTLIPVSRQAGRYKIFYNALGLLQRTSNDRRQIQFEWD